MTQAAIDQLLAKQEITELLYRYCRGADRFDWELVRSCYHDDAIDDHGMFRGSPDEFVAHFSQLLPTMTSGMMHTLSNILITVDGDVAGSEAYLWAWHRLRGDDDNPPRDFFFGGRYVDRLERRGGEWRIAHRTVVSDWTRVVPLGEEFDSGPDAVWGRRDRDDISYKVLGPSPAISSASS